MYGNPQYLPVDENHKTNPINYYGFTKLMVENTLSWYKNLKGFNVISLRYFNAAGYDNKKRLLSLENNPQNLIPIVMEAALGIRSKVEILNLSNEFVVAVLSREKFLTLENSKDVLGYTTKFREDPIYLDPRHKDLGARLITNLEKLHLSLKLLELKSSNLDEYYSVSNKLGIPQTNTDLSLIHISEPTRPERSGCSG